MIKSFHERYHQRMRVREALKSGRLVLDEGVTWSKDFQLKLSGDAKVQLQVGKNSHLAGRFVVRGSGYIRIGSYCHFHEDSYFGSLVGIDIADSVFAAEGIFVVDNNNHPVAPEKRRAMTHTPMGGPLWSWTAEGVEAAPVTIGENIWLGRNCAVLKVVSLGQGSIVALGAVVTKSAPAFSIIAGNPARVVKTISDGTDAPTRHEER